MNILFKDVMYNYFGSKVYIFPTDTAYDGWLKERLEALPELHYGISLTPNTLVYVSVNNYLPILRPKSDLTEDEFKEMAKLVLSLHPNDSLGVVKYEHEWYAFVVDDETRSMEPYEQLTEADSADSENVFCLIKKQFAMAYGVETDSMPFISFEKTVRIINYLRSISIDCDGLIKAGQAIDKTKMKI